LETVFTANYLTDTDKQNSTGNTQTTYNSKKANNSTVVRVASYDTRPRKEMGLFHNAPKPRRATISYTQPPKTNKET